MPGGLLPDEDELEELAQEEQQMDEQIRKTMQVILMMLLVVVGLGVSMLTVRLGSPTPSTTTTPTAKK